MPPNGHMHGISFTLKSRAESPVLMSAVYVWPIPQPPILLCTVVSSLPLDVRSCTLPCMLQVQSSPFQVANATLWQ